MGACARNMQSDSAEIKAAQCCIKLVFYQRPSCQFFNTHDDGRITPETCKVTLEKYGDVMTYLQL